MVKEDKIIWEYLVWVVATLAFCGLLSCFMNGLEITLFILGAVAGLFIIEFVVFAVICCMKGEKRIRLIIKRIVTFRNKMMDYIG